MVRLPVVASLRDVTSCSSWEFIASSSESSVDDETTHRAGASAIWVRQGDGRWGQPRCNHQNVRTTVWHGSWGARRLRLREDGRNLCGGGPQVHASFYPHHTLGGVRTDYRTSADMSSRNVNLLCVKEIHHGPITPSLRSLVVGSRVSRDVAAKSFFDPQIQVCAAAPEGECSAPGAAPEWRHTQDRPSPSESVARSRRNRLNRANM